MAHPGIVQKDEIAVIRMMRCGSARERDVDVALLPDCGELANARKLGACKSQGGQS